jgi:hypothetical protein
MQSGRGKLTAEGEEPRHLREESLRLRMGRDISEKATAFLAVG